MLYLSLIAGLALLVAGGEGLVRGALNLSHRLGVSKAFIGVAVIGFGTSMPELVVSVDAALLGQPGIAAGNVVGSNIANILLILGISAILKSQYVETRVLYRDGTFLLVVTAAMVISLSIMNFSLLEGIVLLTLFAVFLGYTYKVEKDTGQDPQSDDPDLPDRPPRLLFSGMVALLGIAALAAGADLFVDAASQIALNFGVAPAIIGLSVVAIGTSMPELVASVVAAYRGQSELVVGNIIGSNLFNLLLILGVAVTITPLSLQSQPIGIDLWIMAGATAVLFLFLRTGYCIDRREGVVMVLGYVGYMAFLARDLL